MLDINGIFFCLMAQEQLVVKQHGCDGCYRSQNSRCLRTDKMGTAELYSDGTSTYEEGDSDVLQNLRLICHHQDKERGDVEHQREL